MAFQGDGTAHCTHNEWEARLAFSVSWPDIEVTGSLQDLASGDTSSDKIFITAEGGIQLRIDYNDYTFNFTPALSVGDYITDLVIARDESNVITISANGQTQSLGTETGKLTLKKIFGTTGARYTGRVKAGVLTYEGAYNGKDFSFDFSQESGTTIANTHPTGTASALAIVGATDGVSGLVSNSVEGVDNPPIVNAGADQSINALQTLTLSSTESDDGSITGVWTQEGASDATIDNPAGSTTTVTVPNVTQTLTFRRTVDDGVNDPVYDEVEISVTEGVAGVGTIKKVNVPVAFSEWFPHDIYENGFTLFNPLLHYQMSGSDTSLTPQYLLDNGTVRYVDVENGDNSNNGQSWATAWKSLTYANDQVCDVVKFKKGKYWNDCPGVNNLFEGTAKVFICEEGQAEFYACSEDDSANWIPDPDRTGVYMWENAPSNFGIWDSLRRTTLGTFGEYAGVGSADLVASSDVSNGWNGQGYYYHDPVTKTLYIKTIDSRQPDKHIKLNTVQRWNVGTTGRYAYFEGMTFHYSVKTNTATSTGAQGLMFNKCCLAYGDDADNSITGMSAGTSSRFYLVSSLVMSGRKDNISYQSGARGVELNSISINSTVGGPNNCSTGHGSSRIIRLNSFYEGASGPVIGDIESVQSLNVNCYAANGSGSSFNVNDPETIAYLINCRMPNSLGFGINGGGTVYAYNNSNDNGRNSNITYVEDASLVDANDTIEDTMSPEIFLIPSSSDYVVDLTANDEFVLPRAILKDGILLTDIQPSTNNYSETSNGTFSIEYTGQDAESNVAEPASINVYQTGYSGNTAPITNAGPDQQNIISGGTLTLNGSSTLDPDGVIVSTEWSQTAGTNAIINDPGELISSVTLPTVTANETMTFELTITDSSGYTYTDSVSFGVLAIAASSLRIDSYTIKFKDNKQKVIKGFDNEVFIDFTFTNDFTLSEFTVIEVKIGDETYSTIDDPTQVYILENRLVLNIGENTTLEVNKYKPLVIGKNAYYNSGHVFTSPVNPVLGGDLDVIELG